MRNMAVLHSPAFSYPLPVLVRVLFNLLIFKGKILYYNKYNKNRRQRQFVGQHNTKGIKVFTIETNLHKSTLQQSEADRYLCHNGKKESATSGRKEIVFLFI